MSKQDYDACIQILVAYRKKWMSYDKELYDATHPIFRENTPQLKANKILIDELDEIISHVIRVRDTL